MAATGPVPEELSIDSTHVKAHRLASGSKRGSTRKRLAAHVAEEQAKSMLWPLTAIAGNRRKGQWMIKADRSPLP